MRTREATTLTRSTAVLRSSQGSDNPDANALAQLEMQRIEREDQHRRSKMESFMNNTKINASKLQKQKQLQVHGAINLKKAQIDKQKQIQAQYTIHPQPPRPKVAMPNTNIQNSESECDSDEPIESVESLLKKKEELRGKMLLRASDKF